MNRWFRDELGSATSELSFGVVVVGILLLGVLWVMAQLEGVSFFVLLHQIRSGH
jgi:heme/copper-type cytochrome/quinol oxidase subunit 4